MGLFSTLNTSFLGLNITQKQMAIVSQNIAGANSAGYVKRRLLSEDIAGPGGGVVSKGVQRLLDAYVQKQLWTETGGAGYANSQQSYSSQLTKLFGVPGATTGLAGQFDTFKQKLALLQASPASAALRSDVISSAKMIANKIGTISDGIKNLRQATEDGLLDSVSVANAAIADIAALNQQLSAGQNDPSLLDNRDRAIRSLAEVMDVNVTELGNGRVSISTKSGLLLVDTDQAATLSFDAKANIGPENIYSPDPAKRGVGTIMLTYPGGQNIDLIAANAIRSGEIAGLIELRDKTLVEAQMQIDDFAAAFSSALSDRAVSSAVVGGGTEIDLTGLQAGNKVRLTYVDTGGVTRKVTIIRVDDTTKLPLDNSATPETDDEVLGVSFSGGLTNAIAAIQTGLNGIGPGLTASAVGTPPNTLRLVPAVPASVSSLTALITNTGLAGPGGELPLFVDSGANFAPFTDSLDGKTQRIGFASRMLVNPALEADPSKLVVYQTPPNPDSDPTRPTTLINNLNQRKFLMSVGSGVGSSELTVQSALTQIVQSQALQASQKSSLQEGQKVVLDTIETKYLSVSGVNTDQELASLTQLQSAYAANARVLAAVREMLSALFGAV
ncbi:MAG: flagellar hook-associated protein FlgK [Hyphomicrobiales bacterium]